MGTNDVLMEYINDLSFETKLGMIGICKRTTPIEEVCNVVKIVGELKKKSCAIGVNWWDMACTSSITEKIIPGIAEFIAKYTEDGINDVLMHEGLGINARIHIGCRDVTIDVINDNGKTRGVCTSGDKGTIIEIHSDEDVYIDKCDMITHIRLDTDRSEMLVILPIDITDKICIDALVYEAAYRYYFDKNVENNMRNMSDLIHDTRSKIMDSKNEMVIEYDETCNRLVDTKQVKTSGFGASTKVSYRTKPVELISSTGVSKLMEMAKQEGLQYGQKVLVK